jgi:hypothetical protein
VENEKCKLKDMEYGQKTEKRGNETKIHFVLEYDEKH